MSKMLIALILVCILPCLSWGTYLNRWNERVVNVSTNDNLTTVVIGAGTSVQMVLKNESQTTFAWDASEDEVDGYYLYCTGPTEIKQQTNTTTVTLTLPPGEYKCWATAYRGETESGPSNGIAVRITEATK